METNRQTLKEGTRSHIIDLSTTEREQNTNQAGRMLAYYCRRSLSWAALGWEYSFAGLWEGNTKYCKLQEVGPKRQHLVGGEAVEIPKSWGFYPHKSNKEEKWNPLQLAGTHTSMDCCVFNMLKYAQRSFAEAGNTGRDWKMSLPKRS